MARLSLAPLALLVSLAGCERGPSVAPEDSAQAQTQTDAAAGSEGGDLAARADALAHRVLILDGHVDAPMKAAQAAEQGQPPPPVHDHAQTNFDLAKARSGGLDAPFMSIYTPASLQAEPGASKAFAEANIDYVHSLAAEHAEVFALARTPDEVRANFAANKISLPLGMENGSPLEGELANLAHFHARGVRYITLAHSEDNAICDSSYDDRHTHQGLSAFGREVVAEMNRLGVMIDVSHISDDAFWQVMDRSATPVIASHSSCRHFTPDFERNMSDEMIRALADQGGVIQINFGGSFLSADYRAASDAQREEIMAQFEARGLSWSDPEGQALADDYRAAHPIPPVDVALVADHIDHVVELVGVEHVGLGSDFDGVGDSLPTGLEDVSMYPNLLRLLLERGYSEADIEKICSGNVLRVWQAVEDHARTLAG
ncbi:membrane dipeptidase [Pseudenhygromyxa sp. WMMC2535]|uniref:dipeptidase n=1 Tax=Pseudenhygromyxa sp. WMMC2535 TaxID=2712867 RepID=UPI0015564257|nr:dipeptidase [Pseudenhygromyxa sp. WMMC2535]NVB40406.1 membrane dipeptidase [Pseudenhygromyxa sp. WMMC2535]